MKETRRTRQWAWGMAMACALCLFVCGAIPLRRDSGRSAQQALSVREDSGYLRITWNSASIGKPATLEIIDGGRYIWVPVSPGLSSATYQPLTGDVQIRLGTDATRFVGPRLHKAASEIEELETEAESLTAAAAVRTRRILELEKAIAKLGSVISAGAYNPERKYPDAFALRKLSAAGTPSPAP